MPTHKVLKSVAHNFAHSFTSLMNYRCDDYVMGHLLMAARRSGRDTLTVDILSGQAGPDELLVSPVRESLAWYIADFPRLVTSMNAVMDFIRSATLRVSFDLSIRRPSPSAPAYIESPYTCTAEIIDDRGRQYSAELKGWWFPETPTV